MISWRTITDRTDYENQRYNFLLWTEERGDPKLGPYNDNPTRGAAGNITIGVGFNLEGSAAVRDEVFRTFGLIRNNPALSATPAAPGQLSAQQIENANIDQLVAAIKTASTDFSALHAIMAARAGDPRLDALGTRRPTFSFNDQPEIRATFDRLMANIYERKVNDWLSAIPDSRERVALVSLAWNQSDSDPLLGKKLRAAVVNGDRAEAWYEIRYNSNSASQAATVRNGIAKRRYFEADTFGLYNNAAAENDADAKGAFRTYTRHKAAIDSYDSQFGSQVTLANSDYNTTIVQSRPAWFQPARNYLISQYGQGIAIDGGILVGEDQSTLYFRGTDNDQGQNALTGTAQNDLIFGESGNDSLIGGGGNDVLYGGAGNDTLNGSTGDDILLGGLGIDEYRWNTGDGLDTIIDEDKQGRIFLNEQFVRELLKEGTTYVTPDGRVTGTVNSPLTLSVDGEAALIIQDFADTDQGILRVREISTPESTTRTIVGELEPIDFDPNAAGVQTQTDDLGNVVTDFNVAAPNRADTLNGSVGADLIQPGGGNDTVTAGAGGDQVQGGTGRDFVYGEAGNDILEGGADGDVLSGGDGEDRLYSGTKGGGTLTDISGAIAAGSGLGTGVQGDWLAGGLGDDILIASADNDVLTGGEGVDLLIGGAGADNLLGDSSYVATSLTWSFTDSGGVRLFAPVVGETDPLGGAADNIYGGSGNDFIRGGRGDDVIYGEGDSDDIAGESGADVVFGGEGNDDLSGDASYVAGSEHGADYIDGGASNDQIAGDGGEDVIFGGVGDDLILGDAVTLATAFHGADFIDAGEGADIVNGGSGDDTLLGGEGADLIVGDAGNDRLEGGAGADTLDGGEGDDRYVADAADTIVDGAGANTIALAQGDGPESWALEETTIGGQPAVVLALAGETQGLTITGPFQGFSFEFANGEVLSAGEFVYRVATAGRGVLGTAGDDILIGTRFVDRLEGFGGNDTLDGREGNDALLGGDDDDVYVLDRGFGIDRIEEQVSSGFDTVRFGADITAADVTVSRRADGDLVLSLSGQDQVTITGQYVGGSKIEQIEFGDGASLTLADLSALPLAPFTGTDGADTLVGTNFPEMMQGLGGDDFLDGRGGNDILHGGDGLDTYAYSFGMGRDFFVDDGGRIELKPGVGFNDLRAVREGNDLELKIRGTATQALLFNYFTSPQDWTIEDATGAQTTAQAVLEETSQREQDWLTAQRDEYRGALKARLIGNYFPGRGYELVGDGALQRPWEASPGAQQVLGFGSWDISDITTTIVLANGAVTVLTSHDEQTSWGIFPPISLSELNATIAFEAQASDDAEIFSNAFRTETQVDEPVVATVAWDRRSVDLQAENTVTTTGGLFPDGGYFTSTARHSSFSGHVGGRATAFAPVGTVALSSGLFPEHVEATLSTVDITERVTDITAGASANVITGRGNDLIDAGAGNDTVNGGGFAYGGEGNDTISNADVAIGGPGNDTILAGNVLYGGAGDDLLEGGSGASRIVFDVQDSGEDIVTDSRGLSVEELAGWYYPSIGIPEWQSLLVTVDPETEDRDEISIEEGIALGLLPPLPQIAANDFSALAPLYAAGVIELDSVEFAQVLSPDDVELSLGEVMVISPVSGALEAYATLDVSWALDSVARIVIPHAEDPLGTGIEQFKFADGTVLSLAQMLERESGGPAPLPTITGTEDDDFIIGTADSERILGLGGDDSIDAAEGDDRLEGGEGSDFLSGGPGNDTLEGGEGSDQLSGQSGNDTLEGGEGQDFAEGGDGDDVYAFGQGDGVDDVFDTDGADTVRFKGGVVPDNVRVTSDPYGNLYLVLDGSDDRVGLLAWLADEANRIETVEFPDGTVWDAAELEGRIESLAATEFGDILMRTEGNDTVDGLAGNDQIYGLGGDDVLAGGSGDDYLEGGAGNDIVRGGDGADGPSDWQGNNLLDGGAGDDNLLADGAPNFVDGGANFVIGGAGNDSVSSYAAGNVIAFNAGEGQDTIYAANAFTLSLGGGLTPAALSLSQDGIDLVLAMGANDSIRFTRQFEPDPQAWPSITLQMFGSVHLYDFNAVIADFQAALSADPSLTAFALDGVLQEHETSVSETEAWGGALAYQYGTMGNLNALNEAAIRQVLADANFGTAAQSIALAGANQAPVVAVPIADQGAQEDSAFNFTIPTGTFSDADAGDTLTLSVALADGSALPTWLAFDAATRTFSGMPANGDVGTLSVKVIATDSGGLSALDTFDVVVANTNDAPVVLNAIADQAVTEDSAFGFTVPTDTFADVDVGDTLAFSATRSDGTALPGWLSFDAASRTFSGMPINADVGTVSVRISATDGSNASASDVFDLTVSNTNDTPVLSQALADLNTTEGQAFSFVVPGTTFTDVDAGDTLTHSAMLASGAALPAWLAFDATSRTFSGTPGGSDVGTLAIRLAATDGSGAQAVDEFNLSVTAVPGVTLTGTSGQDILVGGAGADTISGLAGADQLYGNEGPDLLNGGDGADELFGWTGNDTLNGGAGADTLFGDEGADILNGEAGADVIWGGVGDDFMDGGDGNDTLRGEAGEDLLYGDIGADNLYGGIGNDYLSGGLGGDQLFGEDGTDVLQGGDGADSLLGATGNDLLQARLGGDTLDGDGGNDFLAAGGGADTIKPGAGQDVMAFNRGDGSDTVQAAGGPEDTVSVGGGIRYQELTLSKSNNDLVLDAGSGDRLTFKNWYAATPVRPALNLQVIAEAMVDFNPASSDPLLNRKVQSFDFQGIFGAFEAARAANPALTSWALTNALLDFHLSGSDTEALGGDLAYQYGKNGALTGISLNSAQDIVGAAQFGAQPQALRPLASLQEGLVKLS